MCKVYNPVGSLTAIKSHLKEHDLNEYKSVKQLIYFQKTYPEARRQIISDHQCLIEQEKRMLCIEIAELESSIRTKRSEVEQQFRLQQEALAQQMNALSSNHVNVIVRFINYYKKSVLQLKALYHKRSFDHHIRHSLKHLTKDYDTKNNRHQYIISHFEEAVMESGLQQLNQHDRKKSVIDQLTTSIYGALGEQKVVRQLEQLSDEYILINDFKLKFRPALYHKRQNGYIKSIQIDHILLSSAGIFVIETKNWSAQSLKNLNLYSPVEQIKRTNFALYRLVNGKVSSNQLGLNRHHWGDRRIPVRNLIVLINHKPIEEFQYVKVLTLNELINYINHFPPCFSDQEVHTIADYLININRK